MAGSYLYYQILSIKLYLLSNINYLSRDSQNNLSYKNGFMNYRDNEGIIQFKCIDNFEDFSHTQTVLRFFKLS